MMRLKVGKNRDNFFTSLYFPNYQSNTQILKYFNIVNIVMFN